MSAKKHSWPTRKNGDRYEVLINGSWVSRQRAYQLRNRKAGLCALCGSPRHSGSATYCTYHHLEHRYRQRAARGSRAYKPDYEISTYHD